MTAEYANRDVLVSTEWVGQHLNDDSVRIVEVDYDPAANYDLAHIPGAVLFDWRKDINDPIRRDLLSREQLTALLRRSGIGAHTTIVLYGDFNNWFAAFAFWALRYYRLGNLKILNGGRKKWIDEDRPVTKDLPRVAPTTLEAGLPDESIRAYYPDVRAVLADVPAGTTRLVDVRGPKEFSGEVTAPPEYPTEQSQRGGHIPGAKNIPWGKAVNDDGTFRSAAELEALYGGAGVTSDRSVITYCRIGERSSHTWFVLTYLLGYPNVRNYDGSWTEWGNQIRSPIEKP
jgi:thiosulfate/3-mercaptopyruvate sulfurtransferase